MTCCSVRLKNIASPRCSGTVTVYIPWNRPLDIAAPPDLLTVFGVRVHCLIVCYVVEEYNHARIQTPRKF